MTPDTYNFLVLNDKEMSPKWDNESQICWTPLPSPIYSKTCIDLLNTEIVTTF